MHVKSEKILKLYIFIVLYSSVLKLFLGRWGTLVADIATILTLFLSWEKQGYLQIKIDKTTRCLSALIFITQVFAIFEVFHPNIHNRLYSIIEYRKSYFQVIALLAAYWAFKKTTGDVIVILKYTANISLPIILYGIKQYFFWGDIDSRLLDMIDANFYTMYYGGHMRSVSIFSGPFHYGMFCAILFAIYVFLCCECAEKHTRRFYFICVCMTVVGAVCSITRTSLICIFACSSLWFIIFLKKKRNVSAVLIKLLIILTIVFSVFIIATGLLEFPLLHSNSSLGKMLNSLGNIGEDNRFVSRTVTWREGIENIISSPIIGYGMGSAADTMSNYNISSVYITSHSMFIKIFMEIGLIGGLIYLSIFVVSAERIIKKNKGSVTIKVLCLSLISIIFLNGLVGSTIPSFPSMTLFWIISGVLLNSENDLTKIKGND